MDAADVVDNMLATVMSSKPTERDMAAIRKAVSDPIVKHMNLGQPEFELREDFFIAWQMYQTLSPLRHPFPDDPNIPCPIRVRWVKHNAMSIEERITSLTSNQLIMLGSLLSWGMLRFPCDMNTQQVKMRIAQLIGGRYDLFHTEIPLI